MSIEEKIKKYYKPDGTFKIQSSEKHTSEYNQKLKKEQYRKHRHLILDELLNEIPFHLNRLQVRQIRYWLDRFNDDFKEFHHNSSNETIILAFIMIQRKKVNSRLDVERFTISRKYDLTNKKFITIQNRLIFQLMKTTELTYSQSKHYDHYILMKQGQK